MYELKKIWKLFTTKFVWTGPSSYKKIIYRAAVSQRLRNTDIGGWVGPRAGLDACGKYLPPPGFDPRTVQHIGSRYTDWAIA